MLNFQEYKEGEFAEVSEKEILDLLHRINISEFSIKKREFMNNGLVDITIMGVLKEENKMTWEEIMNEIAEAEKIGSVRMPSGWVRIVKESKDMGMKSIVMYQAEEIQKLESELKYYKEEMKGDILKLVNAVEESEQCTPLKEGEDVPLRYLHYWTTERKALLHLQRKQEEGSLTEKEMRILNYLKYKEEEE